jgi:hypothetical protein
MALHLDEVAGGVDGRRHHVLRRADAQFHQVLAPALHQRRLDGGLAAAVRVLPDDGGPVEAALHRRAPEELVVREVRGGRSVRTGQLEVE